MPVKNKLTKKQREVMDKIAITHLAKGHENDGSVIYFFMDGTRASVSTVNSLLKRGLLRFERGPLGDGQMLVAG